MDCGRDWAQQLSSDIAFILIRKGGKLIYVFQVLYYKWLFTILLYYTQKLKSIFVSENLSTSIQDLFYEYLLNKHLEFTTHRHTNLNSYFEPKTWF